MSFRPYQTEAISSAEQVLRTAQGALLVMATGTGKTFTAVGLCERLRHRLGRVLWLAHRGELLEQAQRSFARGAGHLTCEIEMADQRVSRLPLPDVVCASVQTMQGRRLESFAPDDFGVLVIDEAHHSTAASFTAIVDHFSAAKRVGLTATPDRHDGQALRKVFDQVAYVYDIRDAIRDGYLAPIRAKQVEVDGLDLSDLKRRTGDFSVEDLDAIMSEEGHLHEVVRPTLEIAGDRPTLVFGVTIEHARKLVDVFTRYRGGCARSIDGGMDAKERKAILSDFEAGRFQYLVNVALLTEGVDLPFVSCVSMARPTLSRALHTQMVGRALRLHPGKAEALVLDFVGNTGKHALVTTLDILGGDETDEVRAVARRLMEQDAQLAMLDALDEAREEVKRLDEAKRRRATARVQYQAREVDPFANAAAILGIEIRRGDVEMAPTDEQKAKLEKHGIPVDGIDYWEAQKIARAIRERAQRRLCTVKQAKLLGRYGLRTDLEYDRARTVIDAIAAAGWKLPDALRGDGSLRP